VTRLRERLLPLIERGSSLADLRSMLDDGPSLTPESVALLKKRSPP
jgi:hypothetical protein